MLRTKLTKLLEKAVKGLQKEKKLPEFKTPDISVERPKEKSHGDYSSNIAMQIAKIIKKKPMDVAELIKSKCGSGIFEKVEAVEPGFINFFVSDSYLLDQVKEILGQKDKFGDLKIGKRKRVNVEFISANPTGPLTLGNGRGGFCGDVLASVLKKAGYRAEREYYINDLGEQIRKLGNWEYKGKYIEDLKKRIKEKNPQKAGQKAAEIILKEMIKPTTKKMGIIFDNWFSEESLHRKKEIEKNISLLKKKKLAYDKDDALWFKSSKFGDDKDRVLIKKGGEKTYLASDIAYLENKFERGFEKLIFFWGADHYGYINRIKAAAQALGYKKEQIDIIIMQLVRLIKKGKEVKMSKRTGTYISLDELIDEAGLDAARFFFLMRSFGSHLIFDLDLAKKKSQKNPVYYVQYAYARICSILKNSKDSKYFAFDAIKEQSEFDLVRQMMRFPEVIEDTAKDYQVQRIPQYSIDLADAFHHFYEECRVISEDKQATRARLALISAVKVVLKNTLDLMGVSAPEKM